MSPGDKFSTSKFSAFSRWGTFIVFLALSGCGTVPDAKVTYYYTQTKVSFKAARTVTCDAKNHLIVATTVTPAALNSASDTAADSLSLGQLRGTFSDTDVKFDFYDDGRLKGVNSSSTGQGEAILKAATTLAATIASYAADQPEPVFPTECKYIKDQGAGKPLSLTYEGVVNPTQVSVVQNLKPDATSTDYVRNLVNAIGGVCAKVMSTGQPKKPIDYSPAQAEVTLKARQPGWAKIVVSRLVNGGGCPESGAFWNDTVTVAQLGTAYQIPMPKPATFGKVTLTLAFADSGALSSVQFTNASSAGQALGGINSLLTIAQGETVATKAADVKAQADLIAQQQRLVQCLAEPASCK